jgi:hypothetical protein
LKYCQPQEALCRAISSRNRTILDTINFWPPGTPITAWRASKNVLRSLGARQVRAGRFLIQPLLWAPASGPDGELFHCSG